jgi:hypothetical protein
MVCAAAKELARAQRIESALPLMNIHIQRHGSRRMS